MSKSNHRSGENGKLITFFLFILLVSFICLYPAVHPEGIGSIPPENIVWMLSSSGLVLLMTPGLSFF